MRRVGLLSDTHGYLHPDIPHYFESVDEIWHAGDIGSVAVIEKLQAQKPVRAVYGNVDGRDIYTEFPEDQRFVCEGVKVWMTHIGGYPGKYHSRVRSLLEKDPPDLFISGHSHILKVMADRRLHLLHINPGACGQQGWHRVKTLVRFYLDAGQIKDLEVIELKDRRRKEQ